MASEAFLVGRVGETWIGLHAGFIEAIVPVSDIVPVPHAPRAVRGLVAVRSRLLTLIDSAEVAGCGVDAPSALMVIVSIDGHAYGLTLDQADDVVTFDMLHAVPVALANGWQALADQMADHDGRVVLIVSPTRLVAAAQTTLSIAA